MNLIKQFREFGVQNAINPLPSDAQTLYWNILQVFNMARWPGKSIIRTQTLENTCQMTRKRLTQARNVLIQRGLIKYYQARQASGSPTYELVFLYETQEGTQKKDSVFPKETQNETHRGTQKGTQEGTQSEHLYKQKENDKPKQNNLASNEAAPEPSSQEQKKEERKNGSAAKKKEEVLAHWQALVNEWFRFYEEKFHFKPSFDKGEPKYLHAIVQNLEQRAKANNRSWDEQDAVMVFRRFLEVAMKDKWLPNNFLLMHLNNQFDKILNDARTGGSNNSPGGPTGSGVSIASAFATIDEMPD